MTMKRINFACGLGDRCLCVATALVVTAGVAWLTVSGVLVGG